MADLDYVVVEGRLGRGDVDSLLDPDTDPDLNWCDSGEVWFTPLNLVTKVLGADPKPATIGQSVIKVSVVEGGYLRLSENREVKLIDLTSPKVNPRVAAGQATHNVEFKNVKSKGVTVAFPAFKGRFAADTLVNGVCDITLLSPVPGNGGTPITTGQTGKSAYDLWISLGNTGTVAQFLESLRGTVSPELTAALEDSIAEAQTSASSALDSLNASVINAATASNAAAAAQASATDAFGSASDAAASAASVEGVVVSATVEADRAQDEADRASNEADRSYSQAQRSFSEADRAEAAATAATAGGVRSINGESPDASGELSLSAADVGARPGGNVPWGEVSGKPATYPPSSHNHTSVQITDLAEAIQDTLGSSIAAGANVNADYNDDTGVLTISVTAPGEWVNTDPEVVRDTIGGALSGVGVISVTVNDAGDTITISSTATQNSTDAFLRARANHTGTQAITTIGGLQGALDGKVNNSGVSTFYAITQAAYDAIQYKDGGGVYLIQADSSDTPKRVQNGATKNATDAQLRDRSTHTGTQPINTIDGLQAALNSAGGFDPALYQGAWTQKVYAKGESVKVNGKTYYAKQATGSDGGGTLVDQVQLVNTWRTTKAYSDNATGASVTVPGSALQVGDLMFAMVDGGTGQLSLPWKLAFSISLTSANVFYRFATASDVANGVTVTSAPNYSAPKALVRVYRNVARLGSMSPSNNSSLYQSPAANTPFAAPISPFANSKVPVTGAHREAYFMAARLNTAADAVITYTPTDPTTDVAYAGAPGLSSASGPGSSGSEKYTSWVVADRLTTDNNYLSSAGGTIVSPNSLSGVYWNGAVATMVPTYSATLDPAYWTQAKLLDVPQPGRVLAKAIKNPRVTSGGVTSYTTNSTTPADVDTASPMTLETFMVPASGAVAIDYDGLAATSNASGGVVLSVRDLDNVNVVESAAYVTPSTVVVPFHRRAVVSGLTPGTLITWKVAIRSTNGSYSATVAAGGIINNEFSGLPYYGPFTVTVTEL